MRNIFIILLIVVSLGYMFVILYNKYETIVEQENQKKIQMQKTKQE